jgi:hypothetical protein
MKRAEDDALNPQSLLLASVALLPVTVFVGLPFERIIQQGDAILLFCLGAGLVGFNTFSAIFVARRISRRVLVYAAIISAAISVGYAVHHLREGLKPATSHGRSV